MVVFQNRRTITANCHLDRSLYTAHLTNSMTTCWTPLSQLLSRKKRVPDFKDDMSSTTAKEKEDLSAKDTVCPFHDCLTLE
jgi:hypothetical protein